MSQSKPTRNFNSHVVEESSKLLDWLLANLQESRTKIKATLSGRGVKVNGKVVTQFDYELIPGMKIEVSKSKQNVEFKNHYLRIVFEDRYLVVVEKSRNTLHGCWPQHLERQICARRIFPPKSSALHCSCGAST